MNDIDADIRNGLVRTHIHDTMSEPGALLTPRLWSIPWKGINMAERTCSVDDCTKPVIARGWCHMHYKRWQLHGDEAYGRQFSSPVVRIMKRVTVDGNGCWITSFKPRPNGYVSVWARRSTSAHRATYEHFRGPIPEGLVLDHLCRVRHCVNPAHLEAVTDKVNFQRGMSPNAVAWRTDTCKRGHSLLEAYVTATGGRICRECRRLMRDAA